MKVEFHKMDFSWILPWLLLFLVLIVQPNEKSTNTSVPVVRTDNQSP